MLFKGIRGKVNTLLIFMQTNKEEIANILLIFMQTSIRKKYL